MSEIRFWYMPNKDYMSLKITEQNPCGCCKNLVMVEKKIEGWKKENYCFYLADNQTIDQLHIDSNWVELS